jgi:hypothetical protein
VSSKVVGREWDECEYQERDRGRKTISAVLNIEVTR